MGQQNQDILKFHYDQVALECLLTQGDQPYLVNQRVLGLQVGQEIPVFLEGLGIQVVLYGLASLADLGVHHFH